MVVLWVMMLCIRLKDYRGSRRTCCFHITCIAVCNGVQNDDKNVFFFRPKPLRRYFVDWNWTDGIILSDFIVKSLWPKMGNTKIYGSLERKWEITYSNSHIPRILIITKNLYVCLSLVHILELTLLGRRYCHLNASLAFTERITHVFVIRSRCTDCLRKVGSALWLLYVHK